MSIDPQDTDALHMKIGSATDEGVGSEIITLDVAALDVTDLDARLRRVTDTTCDPYQVC